MSFFFMSKEETVGELREMKGELNVQWRIPHVFSLSAEVDKCYHSPEFYFSGSSWYIRIYMNGQSKNNSQGHIAIHLMKGDAGPPRSVTFQMSFRTVDGMMEQIIGRNKQTFEFQHRGWGATEVLPRWQLLERKSELAPSGVLTILCSMTQDETRVVRNVEEPEATRIETSTQTEAELNSLSTRLQNLSSNLKKILTEGKRSDVTLKVGRLEFPAHRMILESRSSVFAAMFGHDMEEELTGEVNIQDVHPDALQAVLSYMYSGEVDGLSHKNVLQIYEAADKYDLKELMELCVTYLKKNYRKNTSAMSLSLLIYTSRRN